MWELSGRLFPDAAANRRSTAAALIMLHRAAQMACGGMR